MCHQVLSKLYPFIFIILLFLIRIRYILPQQFKVKYLYILMKN